jgi:vitamin B12 transporter
LNDAKREHFGYQSDVSLGSVTRASGQHLVTLAFDWDGEDAFIADRLAGTTPTRAERNNFGGTFQDQAIWDRLVLTNGFRVEDNGSFGKTVVPRSSVSYLVRKHGQAFGATKLKFNFGLGIKEPTFTQSFSPSPSFAGNPNLRPERARSFDYGIEQRFWGDRAKLELNGFNNLYREIIAFRTISFVPFRGTFFNLAQSRADGAEVVVEVVPHKGVRLGGNYTFLQGVIERSSRPTSPVFRQGQELFRRPKHSGSIFASWDWKPFTVTSNTIFVGRRVDSDFSSLVPPIISDPSYTKWDIGWNYRSGYRITYFGIFENALNQRYMEALGFPALRASYRAGARMTF